MMVNKLLGRNVLCTHLFFLTYIQFKYKVYKTECLQGHVEFRALYMKILWHCGTIPLTSLFKLNIFLLLEWSFSLPNYWRNFPILVAFLPQLATEFSSAPVICSIFLTKTKKLGSFRHFKIILNTIFMIILQHILIT